MAKEETDAWASYLDARLMVIHQWTADGESPSEIADKLSRVDETRVRLLAATDARRAIPCSMRWSRDRYRGMFELMGVAKLYGEKAIDRDEMQKRVASIVEWLP